MAWKKLASETLTSDGDAYEFTNLPAKKFLQFLDHTLPTGLVNQQINFNNDTGTNYTLRFNNNGGTDGTGINRSSIAHEWNNTTLDRFVVDFWSNISGEEKLGILFSVWNDATGAGTAPSRYEEVWKWVDTDQVTEIDMINASGGDYLTDSNLTVLGTD